MTRRTPNRPIRLLHWLRKLDMTQRELAKEIGLTESAVSQILYPRRTQRARGVDSKSRILAFLSAKAGRTVTHDDVFLPSEFAPVGGTKKEIAERLKAAIQQSTAAAGDSQNSIGEMLGVSSGTISSWANGRTQPWLEQFSALCALIGVSSDAILGVTAVAEPDRHAATAPATRETDTGELILAQLDELARKLDEHHEVRQWDGAEWIPDTEAARRLGTTVGSLANDRVSGESGLIFSKPKRRVMYLAASISKHLHELSVTSTAAQSNVKRSRD